MPQLLERDRVDSSEHSGSRSRGPRKLLAALLGIAVLVPVTTQLVDVFPHWGNPFKQQIVDHSPAPLLLALQDISKYHAATGTFQVVVDVEHDTLHVPSLISGERTTFLGTGSVDAMVDFSNLGPDRVAVSPDRRSVIVALPAPRLAPAVLDPAASRVVGRERGLLNRIADALQDNPADEQELYQLAQAKLNEAAKTSDLARRGQENTRQMLTTLAGSLGFSDVTVTFETV
ncbi:MAG TPA: DUF4230 domain-containing protein [Pseudonocardiaceae bacterium]|jgi:hypothetical protein|nr:DUF4230 domain-containing protein [Pseudonocardiaceae bacterium]